MPMEHIVNCSLGKDSVAMLAVMLDEGIPIDKILYADVGEDAEFEETYDFIDKVESVLDVQIDRIRSEKWTWDSIFYGKLSRGKSIGHNRGFPPVVGPGCRYKDWLKHKPLEAAQGAGNIIYIGIAYDEARRADAKQYQNGKNEYRFPLVEKKLTEAECRQICESKQILHPLYKYFRRLGCWQCPKQSIASLRSLYKYWPDKWRKLQQYQDDCLWPFKPDCRVEDLAERFENEPLQYCIEDRTGGKDDRTNQKSAYI